MLAEVVVASAHVAAEREAELFAMLLTKDRRIGD
jgi:hypothetical protein